MPLENANSIAELNEDWPLGTDPMGQGDNHIRLLKKLLKKDVAVNAASHLTLAQAQAADLQVGRYVILTDFGNALYQVVLGTDTGGYYQTYKAGFKFKLIGVSAVLASGFGFTTTGDNTTALQGMLSYVGTVINDLVGVFEAGSVSVTNDSLKIVGGDTCVFKSTQAENSEFFVKINTTLATATVDLGNTIFDADNKAAKVVYIENTVKGERLDTNFTTLNARQTASTGIASGVYVKGGFNKVRGVPEAYEINSVGGSLAASGMRTEQNGSAVSKSIRITPIVKGVRPSNDGDGVALLQSFPFTEDTHYEVINGTFENCIKRAVKTQCKRTTITSPTVIRTEDTNPTTGGNIEFDAQYGNCTITSPTLKYKNSNTVPANGLFAMNPQRGNQTDFAGVSTTVVGGRLTFDEAGSSFPLLANSSSFDGLDINDAPTIDGFSWDGTCDETWEIRPVASPNFNDDVVRNPVLRNLTGVIGTRLFKIDRSGTGYAFVRGAIVIGVKNTGSAAVPLDFLVSSNTGIRYKLRQDNTGLVDDAQVETAGDRQTVAVNAAGAYTFTMKQLSAVEVTAIYSAGSPADSLARKSLLSTGNEAGEFEELNIFNSEGSYGPFTMTASFNGTDFVVTVTKPAGVATSDGRMHIIVNNLQGETF